MVHHQVLPLISSAHSWNSLCYLENCNVKVKLVICVDFNPYSVADTDLINDLCASTLHSLMALEKYFVNSILSFFAF